MTNGGCDQEDKLSVDWESNGECVLGADESAMCSIMQFQKMNRIMECPLIADLAHEQGDPGTRMSRSPVMLSRSEASRWPVDETLRCGSG